MKLLVWIVIIGAGILALGFVTGFWQLFTPSHPNTQISSNDTMIPTVKGQTDGFKQVSVFCLPTYSPTWNFCVW